ncbi:MAG: addiction module toxin, HicA family [Dehalococcoidia bacterium]|nr:addiction module toxin, HicA family [Dehalococcoidia bacterium]
MTLRPDLFRRLRTVTARSLVRALERDGFTYRRRKGSGRVYRNEDGRRVVLHYHGSSDTFPVGTLRSMLKAAQWTEDDLRRLRLI